MFDIRLSDEQRQFQKLERDFAQNEIKPNAMPLDREPDWEKRVPWDLLKKARSSATAPSSSREKLSLP